MSKAIETKNPYFTESNTDDLLTVDNTQQDHDFLSDMDWRARIAHESETLWWSGVILILVIVDFIIWIVELADANLSNTEGALITTRVSLVVAVLLCLEWLLRLYVVGPSTFLLKPLTWVDFFASFGGLILVSIALNVLLTEDETSSVARYFAAVNLARLARVFRVCFIIGSQRYNVINATRRLVSQNRRRFKDAVFDLDLTYVTDGIIAMSLPAHKKTDQMYRNNIDDVEKFVEDMCTTSHSIRSNAAEMYETYRQSGGDNIRKVFIKNLVNRGFEYKVMRINGSSQRAFIGIGLKNQIGGEEDPE